MKFSWGLGGIGSAAAALCPLLVVLILSSAWLEGPGNAAAASAHNSPHLFGRRAADSPKQMFRLSQQRYENGRPGPRDYESMLRAERMDRTW